MKHLRYVLPLLLQALSFIAAAQPGVADSLLTIIRLDRRDKSEARALNDLAAIYSRTDLPKAIRCLHEAIDIASTTDLIIPLSNAYTQMVIDQQNVGEKDSALFFLDKLKALAEAHQEARVNYTHAAGLYYKRLQNFKAALPFLLENLHDAVQNAKTDSSIANLTGLAGACLNVGNTVSSMGDYKAAQR
jgi:hypothetical protein